MKAHPTIIHVLLEAMKACRQYDASFEASLKEARHRFNKEVREEADATPLTTPSK
jgi:hypothetical protein